MIFFHKNKPIHTYKKIVSTTVFVIFGFTVLKVPFFGLLSSVFCQNAHHYDCLEKETGITKQDLEKQENKLICNIGQPCLYLRNQQFRDTWFKKYGNTQDCNDVNHFIFYGKVKKILAKKNKNMLFLKRFLAKINQ